ncbi:DUF5979 domain-containing protein [Actinomyces ruminicola]|uniref:Uncharacterized protein n=1 Tax=Actinomyces ruminicola TaxID=332524 RepID=A0A1G9VAF8_9ACTO|nr:DUF5979 domain-containing protein [Actinomyces ruminicola]SDM69047.1 hypothetical protein SAMN04487766_105170 [Actinomyces ruminicola]
MPLSHAFHRTRSAWRRLFVVVAVGVLALASLVAVPPLLAAPEAEAAGVTLTIGLGETTAQISNVKTYDTDATINYQGRTVSQEEYARLIACLHYSPQDNNYNTGVVAGSTGQWAAFSYGLQERRCVSAFNNTQQSAMGFKPTPVTSTNVGDVFLVGTLRHNNVGVDPVATTSKSYYGNLEVNMAHGEIKAVFPFREWDTPNTCNTMLGADGNAIIGGDGKTEYAWNRSGTAVGRWGTAAGDGSNYTYAWNFGTLQDMTWYYGTLGKGASGPNGVTCSDDMLEIASDRSDTSWTDPSTGISYKLRLWGFVNNGANETCTATPEAAAADLDSLFITAEDRTTYGCLYGSLEQIRPVTFTKVVEADDSLQATTAIPTFSFSNVSAEGSYGAEKWGTPASLTPTGWGTAGAVSDPTTYELLAPNDAAVVQENAITPALTATTSGWTLGAVTCTYKSGGEEHPLMRRDGQRMDTSDSVDLANRTIRLDQAELATSYEEAAINCTWHNQYVAHSRLTLVNEVGEGDAQATDWTLTATPVAGLSGQKTLNGVTGDPAVTAVTTGSGAYELSTSEVDGYAVDSWSCVLTGTSTAVTMNTATQVVLPADADVTCTATQKLANKTISFAKALSGATDGTNLTSYRLSYTCTKEGNPDVTGTATVSSDGTVVAGESVPVGASCTVTEQAPQAADLSSSDSGSFSWGSPADYAVTVGDSPVSTTRGGDGVSFTVPGGQGDLVVTVTNQIFPHAGVTKTFDSVAEADALNGNATFDQTYTITVTNPSRIFPLRYSLEDAVTVPANTTVNSITVSGDPLAATQILPEGQTTYSADDIALGAGQRHVYTVVVNVTAPDAGLAGPDDSCTAQDATAGRAVHNAASVTTRGITSAADACGTVPANPRFSVSKQPGELVRNSADGTFTAGYTVTVTNTSHAASTIINDVTDTPDLPVGARINGVEVLENGVAAAGVNVPPIVDGVLSGPVVLAAAGTGPELAAAPEGSDAGGARSFTVRITFTVDPTVSGYDAADYQCGGTRADGHPSGLVNAVSMDGDTSGEDDNTACLSTQSVLKFSKTVATQPGAGASFDVAYDISVVNEGALPGSTGRVIDQPAFAPGMTVAGATISRDDGGAQAIAPHGDGAYVLTDGEIVASGQTVTWRLTLSVVVDPAAAGYEESLLSCSTDAAGLLESGHGLYNAAVPPSDVDQATDPDHNVACASVSPDAGKRVLSVIKTGSQGNLDGAEFSIYPTDPSASGATAIADGVVPSGDMGVFTTAPLPINHEYWLVETRAPAGHQLLANPVHIRITETGISVLNDSELGVSTALASQSSGAGAYDVLTIRDLEAARLPNAGSNGLVPSIAAALLLLVAAVGMSWHRRHGMRRL